jgi:hypothetical protein
MVFAAGSAQAQGVPNVATAESTVSALKAEYAKKIADAEANLRLAQIAQAQADIKAADAAALKASDARKYLAAKGVPVSTSANVSSDGTGASAVEVANAKDIVKAAEKEDATQKFGGIEFGVGISLTADIGSQDRVVKGSVVNGIVRADQTDNSKARIMLESHYFFTPERRFLGLGSKMWGVGPFVALRPGSDDIIDAIAFGGMIGFRRAEDSTSSFNIGIGLVIDPNVQILGEGITLNKPLPEGEADIRFRQTSQKGILGMVSFSF